MQSTRPPSQRLGRQALMAGMLHADTRYGDGGRRLGVSLTNVLLRSIARACRVKAAVAAVGPAVYAQGASVATASELIASLSAARPLPLDRILVYHWTSVAPGGEPVALYLFDDAPRALEPPLERVVHVLAAELAGAAGAGSDGDVALRVDDPAVQLANEIDASYDPAAVLDVAADGEPRLRHVNAAFSELFGYPAHALIGSKADFLHGPLTDPERIAYLAERVRTEREARSVVVYYRADGVPLWVELSLRAMAPANNVTCVVATLRDVTALKEFERAIAKEKRKLQVTLAAIGDGVITTVADGRVDFVNRAAYSIFGIDAAEAYGHPIGEVLRLTGTAGEPLNVLDAGDDRPGMHRGQALFDRGGGALKHIAFVTSLIGDEGYVVVLRDVTAQHRLATQLSYEASHDPLTSIYNRRKFDEVLEDAIETARRGDGPHALAFLDLDRFKIVNDSCGHATGDRVLVELAHLVQQQLRGRDVLARIGGDEFAVLLHDCTIENARRVLEKLRLAVESYRLDCEGTTYRLGVSIGVAIIDGTESDARAIFGCADAACYVAKSNGRNAIAG